MAHIFYLQHGGGLGDFYNYIYRYDNFHHLSRLKDGERALVFIQAHNPFTEEFFTLHERCEQIDLISFGYRGDWKTAIEAYRAAMEGKEIRATTEYQGNLLAVAGRYDLKTITDGLRCAFETPLRLRPKTEIAIPPSFEREVAKTPYIIIHSVAGESRRNIPDHLENAIIEALLTRTDYGVVLLGKNYVRFDHKERAYERWRAESRVMNLTGQLNVYETMRVVRRSLGAVCSHSSISMVSWHERIPQLLLYDKATARRHFTPFRAQDYSQIDWAWGVDLPLNVSATFEDYEERPDWYFNKFLKNVKQSTIY